MRIQSFHLAISHLRCFDARLTVPDGRITFNFWDRDNDFIKGVRRVPPYTELFWAMFYTIAPFLGGMKKVILEAKTAQDVDAIKKIHVKVPIPDEHNEGEFIVVQVPLLSVDIQAMIDNMLSVACYEHKKMFEDRVPQTTILAFRNVALRNSRENEGNFYYLWKQYLAKSGGKKDDAEVEKQQNDLFMGLFGDDDDDGAAAGGAAAGRAAAEKSAAAPEPEASGDEQA
jgi:hypothetical protein